MPELGVSDDPHLWAAQFLVALNAPAHCAPDLDFVQDWFSAAIETTRNLTAAREFERLAWHSNASPHNPRAQRERQDRRDLSG